MSADIFTKGFTGAADFLHAGALINVGIPDQLLSWWTDLSNMRLNIDLEVILDDEGKPLPKDRSKVAACSSLMIASLTSWSGMQFDLEHFPV